MRCRGPIRCGQFRCDRCFDDHVRERAAEIRRQWERMRTASPGRPPGQPATFDEEQVRRELVSASYQASAFVPCGLRGTHAMLVGADADFLVNPGCQVSATRRLGPLVAFEPRAVVIVRDAECWVVDEVRVDYNVFDVATGGAHFSLAAVAGGSQEGGLSWSATSEEPILLLPPVRYGGEVELRLTNASDRPRSLLVAVLGVAVVTAPVTGWAERGDRGAN